jgi:LAS superfamily LD-carboxypeptidase LdcB
MGIAPNSFLVAVDSAHRGKKAEKLDQDAYTAFKVMHAAAKAAGHDLRIVSGYRAYGTITTLNTQAEIWQRKTKTMKAAEILTYSSMPGTSRHHWGTDMDLMSTNTAQFADSPPGIYLPVYEWLKANGPTHGFCQPYTAKPRPGYNEERWHWSYRKKSKCYLQDYMSVIGDQDIVAAATKESLSEITLDIVQAQKIRDEYVNGVDSACL